MPFVKALLRNGESHREGSQRKEGERGHSILDFGLEPQKKEFGLPLINADKEGKEKFLAEFTLSIARDAK
jgi:hypothetical protein